MDLNYNLQAWDNEMNLDKISTSNTWTIVFASRQTSVNFAVVVNESLTDFFKILYINTSCIKEQYMRI